MRCPCLTCAPRLYVYSLDEAWRDPTHKTHRHQGTADTSPAFHIGLESGSSAVPIFDVGQWSLADIFHRRALAYRCRVTNASLADLFLVPAFSIRSFESNFSAIPPNATTIEAAFAAVTVPSIQTRLLTRRHGHLHARAPQQVPAATRRLGRDHILVQPRTGAHLEQVPFRELDYDARRFRGMTRLSIESPRPDARNYSGYYAEPYYDGVPWPSSVRAGRPWADTHARPLLVAAGFHVRGPFKGGRRRLRSQCRAAGWPKCAFAYPAIAPQKEDLRLMFQLYWNATYCLQPPGDAISRKGVVDCLLLGCIPVFFDPAQRTQWPWHYAAWSANASVLLSGGNIEGTVDALDRLARIPASEVRRMQATIAANAWRLVYRVGEDDDEAGDAFSITLDALARRAASAPGGHGH